MKVKDQVASITRIKDTHKASLHCIEARHGTAATVPSAPRTQFSLVASLRLSRHGPCALLNSWSAVRGSEGGSQIVQVNIYIYLQYATCNQTQGRADRFAGHFDVYLFYSARFVQGLSRHRFFD